GPPGADSAAPPAAQRPPEGWMARHGVGGTGGGRERPGRGGQECLRSTLSSLRRFSPLINGNLLWFFSPPHGLICLPLIRDLRLRCPTLSIPVPEVARPFSAHHPSDRRPLRAGEATACSTSVRGSGGSGPPGRARAAAPPAPCASSLSKIGSP